MVRQENAQEHSNVYISCFNQVFKLVNQYCMKDSSQVESVICCTNPKVFKQQNNPANYRPTSLLPIIKKLLENYGVVLEHMERGVVLEHLMEGGVLTKDQWVYSQGKFIL